MTGLGPRTPRYALWHATTQNTRYLPLDNRIPVVLTIHDLNFLREKPPEAWRHSLLDVQGLVDRAVAVTTISKFVAAEVRTHLNLGKKPLRVIYNGLIAQDYPEAEPSRYSQAVGRFCFRSVTSFARKLPRADRPDDAAAAVSFDRCRKRRQSAYADDIRRLAAKATSRIA